MLDAIALTRPRPGVLADRVPGEKIRDVALVAGYALTIGLSAQLVVHLPFTPVPITGQTLAVLAGALLLGRVRAVLGSLLYLGAGIGGVPWFAPSSGASLGYVFGFVLAAWLLGYLAEHGLDRRWGSLVASMLVGNLLIYVVGVPYLAAVIDVGIGKAIALGVLPFIAGDLVKIVIASCLLPAVWDRIEGEDPPIVPPRE